MVRRTWGSCAGRERPILPSAVPLRPAAKASYRWVDALLLVTLVPCWIVAFALQVRQVVTSRLAWAPMYVSRPTGPESFPVVVGFRPDANAAETGLELGDRLVRAGGADLRGVGPIGVVARLEEQADEALRVPVAYERGARAGTVILPLVPVEFPWRLIPLTLAFAVVGVLVLLRLPGSRLARTFLLAALSFSFQWTFFFGGSRAQTYAWTAVLVVSTLLTFPLILRVPMLFPPEVASESGRLPRWPWAFSILGPIAFSWVYGFPLPPAIAGMKGRLIDRVGPMAESMDLCFVAEGESYREFLERSDLAPVVGAQRPAEDRRHLRRRRVQPEQYGDRRAHDPDALG